MKVLIIIPCYNEQECIVSLVEELKMVLQTTPYSIHYLVINDCSKDNTLKLLQKNAIPYMNLPINLGIGGAVQTGFKYAQKHQYDVCIQMDGDGQHPPDQLVYLLMAYLNNTADVIIGSRFLAEKSFTSTFFRRLGIQYFSWLNKLFIGKKITDSTSGYRLFNQKAINIATAYYPDEYPEPESLVVFSKAGLRIEEIPIKMRSRLGGVSSISSFGSVYYMFKVSIAMFFSYIRKN